MRATGYVHPEGLNARRDFFAGRTSDYVQRARERIRDRIVAALGQAPYAGVIVALAIGDQRAIPEAQWKVFNRTGISHLVSISGLHVTVFAALAGGIAYALARRNTRLTARIPARKLAAVVGVVAAGGYVLLAGAEVPAVRTFAMLAIAACGLWWGRPGTAGIVWLWALVAVLLWDPWATLTPGFWLSFGAVGLLLYASVGRLRTAPAVGCVARLRDAFRDGAHAQWVVTLGLAPMTLALFQQVSLIAPIANAVAIPVVTLGVVPLALLGIAVPVDLLFQASHAVLALLMRFLETLAALPDATWQQHAPLPWTVVAGIAGTLCLMAPRGVPGRAWGLLWLLPLFVVRPEPPPHGAFRLTVLDVGQGLSTVIETHRYTLVYDAGPRFGETTDAGGRIVAPFLRAAGLRRADGLIISHQDLDHSGGTLSLMQATPVGWFASSLPADHAIVMRAQAGNGDKEGGRAVMACIAGQRWTWDGVQFTSAASDAGGVRRSAGEDQRSFLRGARRLGAWQCLVDRRPRGKVRGAAVAIRIDSPARRRAGRPASRVAHVLHAGIHPCRRAGDRGVRVRLPQPVRSSATGHRRPLRSGFGANVAHRHERRGHVDIRAGRASGAGVGTGPATAVLDGCAGGRARGCRYPVRGMNDWRGGQWRLVTRRPRAICSASQHGSAMPAATCVQRNTGNRGLRGDVVEPEPGQREERDRRAQPERGAMQSRHGPTDPHVDMSDERIGDQRRVSRDAMCREHRARECDAARESARRWVPAGTRR